jgi:hypothetical protein
MQLDFHMFCNDDAVAAKLQALSATVHDHVRSMIVEVEVDVDVEGTCLVF